MTGVCIDNVLIHAIIHLLFKSTLALKTLLMKMPWVLIFGTILQWYAILLDYTGEYEGTKQRITNSYLVKEHFKVCYGPLQKVSCLISAVISSLCIVDKLVN